MALTKVEYENGQTVITAENMNDIQEAVIALEGKSVYIGPTKPRDGSIFWLDTSEDGAVVEPVVYTVISNLTAVTIDNAADEMTEGESYTATITANYGYTLSSVTVTMGGDDITSTAYSNGTITIAEVTGDIVITAVAVEVSEEVTTYTITSNLTNVTSNNSAVSAEENASYTAILTAADGYELDSVTVTMGGDDVTSTAYSGGVITISAITGDVVITATATESNIDFSAENVYASTQVSSGNARIAFVSNSSPTWDDFMALKAEKLYFYFVPFDQYKKKLSIGASYNSGYGSENIASGVTIAQATGGTYAVITNAWDKYSESGYVVFEIDVAALQTTVQTMYDDGTLDSTKQKVLTFQTAAHVVSGSTAYLLYNYNG